MLRNSSGGFNFALGESADMIRDTTRQFADRDRAQPAPAGADPRVREQIVEQVLHPVQAA